LTPPGPQAEHERAKLHWERADEERRGEIERLKADRASDREGREKLEQTVSTCVA
jgi:hypothetical protein